MPDLKSTEIAGVERADGSAINEMADKAAAHEIPVLYIGTRYDPRTQYVSKDGGTVYNILPSDPRMEAVFGERKYNPRDMDTVAKKQTDKIEELERKLNELAMAKATEPVKQAAHKTESIPYDTLIQIARRIDPTIKGRPGVAKLRAIVFGSTEGNEEEIAETEGIN